MSRLPYRCLVFDWDGTLIDSIERIVTSLQAATRKTCSTEISDEAARHVIGMGLMEAIAALLPDADSDDHERAAEAYKQDFIYDNPIPSPLFEGVRGCLEDYRDQGYLITIATGKSRPGLEQALAEHRMQGLFHATRCAGEFRSKPDPHMLLDLIGTLAIAHDDALMIGDSEHDLRMASNAGVASIAVTTGTQDADTLMRHSPLACLEHITDLSEFLAHN